MQKNVSKLFQFQLKSRVIFVGFIAAYLCEECGSCFVSKRNMELHQLTHDPNRKARFQCPDCPKKFFREQYLKLHSQKHQDNHHICTICQGVFKSLYGLRNHMSTYLNVIFNLKNVCTYNTNFAFFPTEIHQRTEDDRKYACKLCPRRQLESTLESPYWRKM